MFQRLSNLLFGEAEDAPADPKGPNPCVSEADEEGWLLVNLAGSSDWMQAEEGRAEAAVLVHPCAGTEITRTGIAVSPSSSRHKAKTSRIKVPRRGSTPLSPSSGSESERCCMDESWFVTPPPCFTAEGATAEVSPMEDLLIEHPSMSVYVSGSQTAVEETTTATLTNSRVIEPSPPPTRSTMSARITHSAPSKVTHMAKVTHVARIQRAKAWAERRHLSRKCMQRQNRSREQDLRRSSRAHAPYLHQPCQRTMCH